MVREVALTGTPDQQLLQALRNLWPILSPTARHHAIHIADTIKGDQNR